MVAAPVHPGALHRDDLDQSLGADPFAYGRKTGRNELEARFKAFAEALPRNARGEIRSELLVDRACPVCGGHGIPRFEKYGFTHRRCGCGMSYVSPILDQAQVASEALGDRELSHEHLRFVSEPHYRACAERRFEYELQQLLGAWSGPAPARRFLEIGCSAGLGLEVARRYGLEPTGVEPNSDVAKVAQVRGFDVVESLFGPGCVPEASFELAMTLDVLEHVPDPVKFLGAARASLVPGGCLLVQVPNAGSLKALVDGPEDLLFNGLIHVNDFDGPSLDACARAAGLASVRTTSFLSELGKLRARPRSELRSALAAHRPGLVEGFELHQDWINDHGLGYKLLGIYRRPD